MKALLLPEYKRLEIVDLPRPEPRERELLVRVRACGICGSDVHGFDGSSGRRIPPVVMGHEASGVVAATGAGVKRFREGDRVAFDSMVSCGACEFCAAGEPNLCDAREVLGVSCAEFRRDGAFAEYVLVPERIAFPLPDAVPFEHAAMLEPVSVAVHAVNLTPVRLADTAVVVGAGMIGLLCVQALKLAGAGRILAVDPDETRLALAREIGATGVLNPSRCDVRQEVLEQTGGKGAAVALEAAGAADPVATAFACLRKGGFLTLVGNIAPAVPLPLQAVVTRELRISGSCASANEFPACIDLLAAGAVRVDRLITATADLSEGPQWFNRLHAREPGLLKVILRP